MQARPTAPAASASTSSKRTGELWPYGQPDKNSTALAYSINQGTTKMIRKAVEGDLNAVFDLAAEFADKYAEFPIDPDKTQQMLRGLISSGVCFVAEDDGKLVGAIAGMVQEHPYMKCTVLVELGWYATPVWGMGLLKAFIAAGKNAGVDLIVASTLRNSSPSADRLLELRGLVLTEKTWQLKL